LAEPDKSSLPEHEWREDRFERAAAWSEARLSARPLECGKLCHGHAPRSNR
jgi:hypothetical protein